MKRIYDSIPVQSVLYLVNPYAQLKIIDERLDDGKPVIVYEGLVKDLNRTFSCKLINDVKVEKAKVHKIIPAENFLEIHIDTKYEQF